MWKTYDPNLDGSLDSKRWATRGAIRSFGNSAPIKETETEVDEAELDENWMTPPDWQPVRQKGDG